jgi:hypothetical protein
MSLDQRLTKIIANQLDNDEYLEIFLEDGDVVDVNLQSSWYSTLTLGLGNYIYSDEPYIIIQGKATSENLKTFKELTIMLNYPIYSKLVSESSLEN